MRDAKVEEVEHISDDSDEDTRDDTQNQAKLTVAIFPQHQVIVFFFSILVLFISIMLENAKNNDSTFFQLAQSRNSDFSQKM